MILFKKWAKHKVKLYIYWVNQFLREKRHKKWRQECKQKQSLLFSVCNIFDLLISRTEKIAWWLPAFKSHFTYFPIMNNSVKFKEISWTSLCFIGSYLLKTNNSARFLYWIAFIANLFQSDIKSIGQVSQRHENTQKYNWNN